MTYSRRERLPHRELDLMVRHPMPESLDLKCFSDGTINLYRRVSRGYSRKFYKVGFDEVTKKDKILLIRSPDLELLYVCHSVEEFDQRVAELL